MIVSHSVAGVSGLLAAAARVCGLLAAAAGEPETPESEAALAAEPGATAAGTSRLMISEGRIHFFPSTGSFTDIRPAWDGAVWPWSHPLIILTFQVDSPAMPKPGPPLLTVTVAPFTSNAGSFSQVVPRPDILRK